MVRRNGIFGIGQKLALLISEPDFSHLIVGDLVTFSHTVSLELSMSSTRVESCLLSDTAHEFYVWNYFGFNNRHSN